MRRLIVAIGFLTRLPVPRIATQDGDFAAAIRLYPLVGLLIGVMVAAVAWTGSLVDPWVGALGGLVAWVAVTGALHLDGLGDVADGLGAAHGRRERLLAVMSDPHAGSFAVVAIGLQLLAKFVLLHLIAGDWRALVAIPAAARIGPLLWAGWLVPLKPEGLGAAIASAARTRDGMGWLLILAGGCVLLPWLVMAPLLIAGFAWWAKAKVGGVTGDVHGAGIELVETGLCLACAVYWAV
ncbi:adenosylcobinamide-GDP ribazoletransferase [Sphingomonas sp. BIUV-7]|uniref:Adenosylcobinamide-GDP ribazoletransferase n=1 Tax=Sphingomonas natans TaxID=3063330 RepID=A0ABT8Y5R4_9SPHN|nr:adenosylcobinamide-GDP ribazoletransferase [Sphingomonas sp. BIUV-7]MDO6413337.1 adenosylcobinamide-GDP ribazoletransferase [Sphingomonas sp. BIUV-7]